MFMKQKIGILNKGKHNIFIGNTIDGFDIGIKDEGEDTLAKRNKIRNTNKQIWSEKWWVKYLFLPIVVILIGGYIIYKLGWNGAVKTTDKIINNKQINTLQNDGNLKEVTHRINRRDTYVDPKLNIAISVLNISHTFYGDAIAYISITKPLNETTEYDNVEPGKVFHFTKEGGNYSIVIKAVNSRWGYVDISILQN